MAYDFNTSMDAMLARQTDARGTTVSTQGTSSQNMATPSRLEQGGWVGGAIGALLGASPDAAQGYETVGILKGQDQQRRIIENQENRAQQASALDLIIKQQATQGKALELEAMKRDNEVGQAQMVMRLADTKLANERAVNLLKHTDAFKLMDSNEITQKVTDSIMSSDQQTLEFVNQYANSPMIKTEQGYKMVMAQAQKAGVNLQALGLPTSYTPQAALQWKGVGSMAKSVQDAFAAKAQAELAHTRALEVKALEGDYDLQEAAMDNESAQRIAEYNAQADMQKFRAQQATTTGSIEPRDLGLYSYGETQQAAADYVRAFLPGLPRSTKEFQEGDDILRASRWLADEAAEMVRQDTLLFNGNPNVYKNPRTLSEAMKELAPKLVGRVDLSGTFHEVRSSEGRGNQGSSLYSTSTKLGQDRAAWINKQRVAPSAVVQETLEKYKSRYINDPEGYRRAEEAYLSGLWEHAPARGFSTGSKDYVSGPQTARQQQAMTNPLYQ